MLSQFKKEIKHPDGWWEYPNASFDFNALPKVSFGPHAYWQGAPPQWVTRYHGLKFEPLYAVVADWDEFWGGLADTDDKANERQRYNSEARKGFTFTMQTTSPRLRIT